MRKPYAMRPVVGIDGNQWYLLYGIDLMTGHAGFGRTLAEAKADFEKSGRFLVTGLKLPDGTDCTIPHDWTPEQYRAPPPSTAAADER